VVGRARADRLSMCRLLEGKSVVNSLYGVYTMTMAELKALLQQGAAKKASPAVLKDPDPCQFREQRRRMRLSSSDAERARSAKKPGSPPAAERDTSVAHPAVPTRKFFIPFRALEVDTTAGDRAESEPHTQPQQAAPVGTGRPSPIILTSSINLLKFQGDLATIAKGSFEFRISRNGIRLVTKEMADYSVILPFLDELKLHYIFHPKSEKPVKAVIRPLPGDTLAKRYTKRTGGPRLPCHHCSPNDGQPPPASRRHPRVNLLLFVVTLTLSECTYSHCPA